MGDDLDKQARKVMREILRSDPLLVRIAQAMAPAVNNQLEGLDDIKSRRIALTPRRLKQPQTDRYCPGCGEQSSWAPDLCPECLAVNAE